MFTKIVASVFCVLIIIVGVASSGMPAQASAAPTPPFTVTSIDMSVTPSTVSPWQCGSYIQVVYHAIFHFSQPNKGGLLKFYWTVNNGRSDSPAQLTILPGQKQTDYIFKWEGALPSDHFYPEPGGVMVTSPNSLVSKLVSPAGECRG